VAPFIGRRRAGDGGEAQDPTDSFINAAASHHKPYSLMQWIIATADRVASGFEREEFDQYNQGRDETATGRNHFQARLLTLFEQLRLSDQPVDEKKLTKRYPLALLSPKAIFPRPSAECEPSSDGPAKDEYAKLWTWFTEALEGIPRNHRDCLPLWFDHFDSLWLTCTHAIPSATAFNVRPEVSLYDHSRTTAALAAALWRWHDAYGRSDESAATALKFREDFDQQKFLLVQGDFFGIQEFIFASGGQTRKQAAKLLRGRSFQVSLFSEMAALRVLDGLGLPPSSQVINAAGKFLIVAPNTPEVLEKLELIRSEMSAWFEQKAFGLAGIGLAWEPAACNDFLRKKNVRNEETPFSQLLQRLHRSLETAKYRRFDLATRSGMVLDAEYALGPCQWNGRLPADRKDGDIASCALSRDQVLMGEVLVKGLDRLIIVDVAARSELKDGASLRVLETPVFGYALAFTRNQDASGHFGGLAASGVLRRCWDFSLPGVDIEQPVFSGYARRFISGHVPRVTQQDVQYSGRYRLPDEGDIPEPGEIKTLDMLASEDRVMDDDGSWRGTSALGVLKGDIDDLGEIFRIGLRQPSFAKWASLSRQVNGFFAIYLPWLLARDYPGVYTVFAGGDDFFLIGPWLSTQKLAARLRDEFARYVAGNADVHFSLGIATVKAGAPVQGMADAAEDALAGAKQHAGKNAITCFGQTVGWQHWPALVSASDRLGQHRADLDLSTGYVYSLIQFIDMQEAAANGDPLAAIWRSRLAYRTRRMLLRNARLPDDAARQKMQTELMKDLAVDGIEKLAGAFRIPLFNHLYQFRDR
jgi:CRISPR-associated protein Csm1